MKRTKTVSLLAIAAVVTAALIAACASGAPAKSASEQRSDAQTEKAVTAAAQGTTTSPTKQVVRDWANRSMGEEATPPWLKALVRGNSTLFKQDFGVRPDYVVRYTATTNANRNAAMTLADVNFAAMLANELKRTVLTRAAATLQGADFEVMNDTATEAKVTLSGWERKTDFWQEFETEDLSTGQKVRQFNYYIVYAARPEVWDQIVAKYVFDVVGVLPDGPGKKAMAGMYAEIATDTKAEKEKSEAQWKAEIEAQKAAAERAHEQEMAKIQQKTDIAAVQAAYRSGDTAKVAETSATAADVNYAEALALLAAAE